MSQIIITHFALFNTHVAHEAYRHSVKHSALSLFSYDNNFDAGLG